MKKCTFQDCDNQLLAKGLCRKHYLRKWKHGDAAISLTHADYVLRGSDLPQTKHGMWKHPLYPTWHTMMSRCYNPKNAKYDRYGARGIRVCERWHDVRNFVADMAPRPNGKTLDRFDNDGPYSPDNCRWADAYQQARNRPQAKLTDKQRDEALRLYGLTKSPKAVAALLGILPGDVKNVVYAKRRP